MIDFKKPPNAVEFESNIIGSLMISPLNIESVMPILSSHDFYTINHQLYYKTINELYKKGLPYDLPSLVTRLESIDRENIEEHKESLVAMVRNCTGSANLEYYAKGIREKSALRQLIQITNDISENCYHSPKEARDIIDEAESKVHDLANLSQSQSKVFSDAVDVASKAIDRLDELFNQDSNITGLETGFTEIDEATAGLQNGDLIIIAGRPSMGKTSFSMNIAEFSGIKNKKYTAMFSMEMPEEQLMNRVFSSVGSIPSERIRTGKMQSEDWPKLNATIQKINQANLFFNDQGGLTISQLKNYARQIDREARKRQERNKEPIVGLELIIVDYLQLMNADGENRTQEISDISRGLKQLAKELSLPLIALSQLNRSLESRANKRPIMSDLRESGAIEQDADLIFFIYRDEVYNPDSEEKGLAEVILSKHRNGALGNFKLSFVGEYTRFENTREFF